MEFAEISEIRANRVDPRPHIKLTTTRGLRGNESKEIRFLVDTGAVCSVIRPKGLALLKCPKQEQPPPNTNQMS